MFKKEETLDFLTELLSINSPSGYAKQAIDFVKSAVDTLGFDTEITPKGNLIVSVEGEDTSVTRGLSGHVDTLGVMVRSINSDGTLALTKIGGSITPTLDSEYCEIITRDGKCLFSCP